MGLRINQNIAAQNAYRNLSVTDGQMSKALEKLSSGFRINRAADDAAGLSISEGLRSQVGGLKVAVRNAQDGVSVAQTAEGALTEVHAMLQRMNDLAVQYNGGLTDGDAATVSDSEAALADEFGALQDEILAIKNNTTFNGVALFGATNPLTFQVGYASSDTIDIDNTTALGDFATAGGTEATEDLDITAATASDDVQEAIAQVSSQRSALGAVQNVFEHRINSLNVSIENLSASESRIRDTDMAQEMVAFTRSQILSQAGTAMLAQANQAPQGVLQLLR
jgi:flagellin